MSASKVASAASSVTGGDDSDSSSVSGPAAMLSKLKSLQKSDPAKFKEAMSAISKKLTEEADASTDSKQKSALTDMASKFESAGETGDLSTLTPPTKAAGGAGGAKGAGGPPPGGGGGGGGAKGASSSSSSSSSSKTTEAADANQDGTVTETERAAYAAKQAEAKGTDSSSSAVDSKRAANAYAKIQGGGPGDAMKSTMSDINSIIDQYAA